MKELEDRKRESEEWKTKYERACKVSEGSKKTARDKVRFPLFVDGVWMVTLWYQGLESEVEMYKFQLDEARKEIMVLKSVPVTSSNGTLDGRDRSRPGSGR